MSEFHFLRPWWFLALIPVLLIVIVWLRNSNACGWSGPAPSPGCHCRYWDSGGVWRSSPWPVQRGSNSRNRYGERRTHA